MRSLLLGGTAALLWSAVADAALLPRWIGSSFPVPEFTQVFVLAEKPRTVTLDLAVAGWYELTVNGVRVGDAVLPRWRTRGEGPHVGAGARSRLQMPAGGGSHNHIMFGDLSAWAYEYAAGIRPLEPGFRKVLVKPVFPRQCKDFSAECRLPTGSVAVSWSRLDDGRIGLELKTAPGDLSVDVDVPEHVKVVRY